MLNRFRIPEIVLGVYLTICVFALGFVFGSLPHSGQSTKEQGSTKSGNTGDDHRKQENWWNDATADFTLGLIFVGLVQAGLFFIQLRLIRESLTPAKEAADAAKEAADAAKLNALAVINAERAHLYVIVKQHNVSDVISAGGASRFREDIAKERMTPPTLAYVLKNYGKTPALVQDIAHCVSINETEGGPRTYDTPERALEILGPGDETEPIAIQFEERKFILEDAKALGDHSTMLFFYSRATFLDSFNRQHTIDSDFLYSAGRFHLISRREASEQIESNSQPGQPPRVGFFGRPDEAPPRRLP
jgi:hypothetical protein